MSHLLAMKDVQMTDQNLPANEVNVNGKPLGDHSRAPEWIELLPAGIFTGRDGRGPFRLSDPDAVIAATDGLRMNAGLPIDYDHATDFAAPVGRPAPAAGWIRAMEARNGELWGRVEWTCHGAAAVVTHEYRYISPVFEYAQDGEVQRLLRAALTNNPNLYLTAISARAGEHEADASRHFIGALNVTEANAPGDGAATTDDLQEQLREVFGLAEEATPDAIVTEVRKLMRGNNRGANAHAPAHIAANGVDADPARYVPVAQFESALTELNRLRAAGARERAELRVDAAMKGGKIVPAQREWAIAYCQANLRGFEEFVARQPTVISSLESSFGGTPSTGRARVNYHEAASPGGCRTNTALTRTELTVCARLGLRPQEYSRRREMRDELSTINHE